MKVRLVVASSFCLCSFLGFLGQSWHHLGTFWPMSELFCVHLRASWSHPGAILGQLGGILGNLGAILGPFWAHLECLEPSWDHLGPEGCPGGFGSISV